MSYEGDSVVRIIVAGDSALRPPLRAVPGEELAVRLNDHTGVLE
jgi:hypothetical protein